MYLAKHIHKTYRPATVEYAKFFTRLRRPQTLSQNGRSYEYGSSVQHKIINHPPVDLRVIDDARDNRLIL